MQQKHGDDTLGSPTTFGADDHSPLTAAPIAKKKFLGLSRDRSPFLFKNEVTKSQERIGENPKNKDIENRLLEEFNLDKFKRERSKSIAYLQKPPQGNLGLYHKNVKMNYVNRSNHYGGSKMERSQSSHIEQPKLRKGVSIA